MKANLFTVEIPGNIPGMAMRFWPIDPGRSLVLRMGLSLRSSQQVTVAIVTREEFSNIAGDKTAAVFLREGVTEVAEPTTPISGSGPWVLVVSNRNESAATVHATVTILTA